MPPPPAEVALTGRELLACLAERRAAAQRLCEHSQQVREHSRQLRRDSLDIRLLADDASAAARECLGPFARGPLPDEPLVPVI